MATPSDIRDGFVEALAPLKTGAGGFPGFNVQKYPPAQPDARVIEFFPDEVDYDLSGSRGMDVWAWSIQVFVAQTINEANIGLFEQLLAGSGDRSVKALLEADTTLGDRVSDLSVDKAMGLQWFQRKDGLTFFGSTWAVRVIAPGE